MRKVKYNKAYIAVKNLEVNDYMLDINNHPVQIFKIEYIPGDCEVYNLSVNTNYNYYANDILVHNKGFFGCGSDYEGSDDLGAQRAADELAWEGTKTSIKALDRQARQYIEDQRDMLDQSLLVNKSARGDIIDARSNGLDTLSNQSGFLHSGTEQKQQDIILEQSDKQLAADSLQNNASITAMGAETNTFLQNLAQKQADLYASFTSSQVGDQSVDFSQNFSNVNLTDNDDGWTSATTGNIGTSTACFIGGTLVEGKAIEQLQKGDILSSYNIKKNIKERSKVIKLHKHIVDTGYYIINDHLKVTGEHPVFIVGG